MSSRRSKNKNNSGNRYSNRNNNNADSGRKLAPHEQPPNHPQEDLPEHRTFLARSLRRNDEDMAALVDLNRTLHLVRDNIIQVLGEEWLLDLGEGFYQLTPCERDIMVQPPTWEEIQQQQSKNNNDDSEDDDDEDEDSSANNKQQRRRRKEWQNRLDNLLEEERNLCVDFLLRMKLRRRLLNRLSRRLMRVAHAMDGEDVSAPIPPKYGDLRLHVDPEEMILAKRQWQLQAEAKRRISEFRATQGQDSPTSLLPLIEIEPPAEKQKEEEDKEKKEEEGTDAKKSTVKKENSDDEDEDSEEEEKSDNSNKTEDEEEEEEEEEESNDDDSEEDSEKENSGNTKKDEKASIKMDASDDEEEGKSTTDAKTKGDDEKESKEDDDEEEEASEEDSADEKEEEEENDKEKPVKKEPNNEKTTATTTTTTTRDAEDDHKNKSSGDNNDDEKEDVEMEEASAAAAAHQQQNANQNEEEETEESEESDVFADADEDEEVLPVEAKPVVVQDEVKSDQYNDNKKSSEEKSDNNEKDTKEGITDEKDEKEEAMDEEEAKNDSEGASKDKRADDDDKEGEDEEDEEGNKVDTQNEKEDSKEEEKTKETEADSTTEPDSDNAQTAVKGEEEEEEEEEDDNKEKKEKEQWKKEKLEGDRMDVDESDDKADTDDKEDQKVKEPKEKDESDDEDNMDVDDTETKVKVKEEPSAEKSSEGDGDKKTTDNEGSDAADEDKIKEESDAPPPPPAVKSENNVGEGEDDDEPKPDQNVSTPEKTKKEEEEEEPEQTPARKPLIELPPLKEMSQLEKDYEIIKDYVDAYAQEIDPITGEVSYQILNQDEDRQEDYVAIDNGSGVGAQPGTRLSLKEKEVEFKRWQTSLLSRIPEAPTFEEIGMKNKVFLIQERRERLRRKREEEENSANNKKRRSSSPMKRSKSFEEMSDGEGNNKTPKKGKNIGAVERKSPAKKKEEEDKDKKDITKRMKPLPLVPFPSFYESDLRRTRVVHFEMMRDSFGNSAKVRFEAAQRDYNAAFRTSNHLLDRKVSLENALKQNMHHFETQFKKLLESYKMKIAQERHNWQQQKAEYDANRIQKLMPSGWGAKPMGTPMTQAVVSKFREGTIPHIVGTCVADIADVVIMKMTRNVQDQPFQDYQPSKPEPKPDNIVVDPQTGETLAQKVQRVQQHYHQEIQAAKMKLAQAEEERKKCWKKMEKFKAELQQVSAQHRGNPMQLGNQPRPPPSYTPGRRGDATRGIENFAPSAAVNPSSSKYSIARVRERIHDDGTVEPIDKKKGPDGLYQRPPGRARKGMDWEPGRGVWVPRP